MNSNRKFLFHQPATPAALLRGAERIHGNDRNTSFFRFVFQAVPQSAPARIVRREGQVPVSVYERQRHALQGDQVVVPHQAPGELVLQFQPLVGDMLMQAGDLTQGGLAPAAALHLAGSMALQKAQLSQAGAEPARVLDQFTGRQGDQRVQAHIQPNSLDRVGDRFGHRVRKLQHQASVPARIDPLEHHVLDQRTLRQGTVKTHPHLAHILHVETPASLLVRKQPAAVAVGELQAVEPVAVLEARKARRLTRLDPAEEGGKGLVQPSQRLLQGRGVQLAERVPLCPPQIPEGRPLGRVAEALPGVLVGGDALFECGVVDPACLSEQEVELFCLFGRGTQQVLVGAQHLVPVFLLGNVSLDGRFADLPYRPHIVTAAPQAGHPRPQMRIFPAQHPRREALELIGNALRCFGGIGRDKRMNVIGHDFKRLDRDIQFGGFLLKQHA